MALLYIFNFFNAFIPDSSIGKIVKRLLERFNSYIHIEKEKYDKKLRRYLYVDTYH